MTEFYEYDVFISHAVEDKIDIVNELVRKLEESGIKVWYSSDKLRVGRGVEETIKDGLNKSRHGIVVLTHNYFRGQWPRREFSVLWAREGSRIFPVWHGITKEEIDQYDTILAQDWALNTKHGVDFVVRGLVKAIREHDKPLHLEKKTQATSNGPNGRIKLYLTFFFLLILTVLFVWLFLIRSLPSNRLINKTINYRINSFQEEMMTKLRLELEESNGDAATLEEVSNYFDRYNSIAAQYRNEYYFNTGYHDFSFKKNIEPVLGKEVDLLKPSNNYDFTYPNIFVIDLKPDSHTMDVKYIFINTQPIKYHVQDEGRVDDYTYMVEVNYQNHIRYLSVNLTYSKRSDWKKRRLTTYRGFLPVETYQFKKENNNWVFVGLEAL